MPKSKEEDLTNALIDKLMESYQEEEGLRSEETVLQIWESIYAVLQDEEFTSTREVWRLTQKVLEAQGTDDATNDYQLFKKVLNKMISNEDLEMRKTRKGMVWRIRYQGTTE